jgi:uncharacterized RDD family membrane protein YckC
MLADYTLHGAVFWSLIGYTPGKYVMKLRVVRLDGLTLGFWRSAHGRCATTFPHYCFSWALSGPSLIKIARGYMTRLPTLWSFTAKKLVVRTQL